MTTVVVESCRGYGKLAVSTLVNKAVCWPCHLWQLTSEEVISEYNSVLKAERTPTVSQGANLHSFLIAIEAKERYVNLMLYICS